MMAVAQTYLPILVFIGIAIAFSLVFVALPAVVARLGGYNRPDEEKLSAYECGFDAFSTARSKFDVRFYLVAILFIIFDLEVAFLFPYALSHEALGVAGWLSIVAFLTILTVGFVYEWKKGALEWE